MASFTDMRHVEQSAELRGNSVSLNCPGRPAPNGPPTEEDWNRLGEWLVGVEGLRDVLTSTGLIPILTGWNRL